MSRLLTAIAALLALATAAGLAILWPGDPEAQIGGGITVDTERAEVTEVRETTCPGFAEQRCQTITARLESGPDAGRRIQIQLGATGLDPNVDPGDGIKVAEAPEPPPGAPPVAGTGYTLVDFERGTPMLVLALAFVLAVLVFARLRGALSLIGLAISLAVVLVFVVPAILDGEPPLAVAIVGSLAVALVTIPLAHGRVPGRPDGLPLVRLHAP